MLQAADHVAPEVAVLAAACERFREWAHRTAGGELAYDLPEVSRALNLIQLKFSEMAASFAETEEYDRDGSYSPIHWLRMRCGMTSAAAADRVALGKHMQEVPQSVEAMAQGVIGFPHLTLIAREAEAHAESGSNKAFDETRLLDKALASTVGKFRNYCHHHRHATDPERYAAEQAEAAQARSLDLHVGEGGMLWIRGVLDPEGGAILRTALTPLARRSGKHDHRKIDQRMGDALVEFVSNRTKVQMQVTASVETLLGLCGAPGAENEFTLPFSSKTVERWACDCSISRILLQDSVVIDVGRSERTIKGPRRRALIARDQHCQWPGCERTASWCDAHHINHWIRDDGGGEIENQALLCRRHHWMVHEGRWQMVRTDEGRWHVVPPQLEPYATLARSPGRYWAA